MRCPTSLEEWKRVEEKFRTRWNAPHAVGTIDRKHIKMKKPRKSGSDYYNYKSFISLVLLASVDIEYRFLQIDCGSSGSCSDTQIFNRSNLREKIEDGSLGLPAPEPLGEGGWMVVMDGETLQQKTTHKGRKYRQLQDLQRQEGG